MSEAGRVAGWYDDDARPGIQRYWDGSDWSSDIAPRSKPEPAWKQARIIALGILVAVAIVFTVWRVQQPSDSECASQQFDVAYDLRTSVEPACEGR